MESHALRLIWALPLVLMIGVGLLLLLKRWGIGVGPLGQAANASGSIHIVQSLDISPQTKVMQVSVNGRTYLVFESAANLQVLPANENMARPANSQVLFPWTKRGLWS